MEFPWNESSLSVAHPNIGPAICITDEMVSASINHPKSGKAAGDQIVPHISNLINVIINNQVVSKDWNKSYIINLFKGRGDSLDRANFRGLKIT